MKKCAGVGYLCVNTNAYVRRRCVKNTNMDGSPVCIGWTNTAETVFQSILHYKCQRLPEEGPSPGQPRAEGQGSLLTARRGPAGTPRQGGGGGGGGARDAPPPARPPHPSAAGGGVPVRVRPRPGRAAAAFSGAPGLLSGHDAFLFRAALWLDTVNLGPRQDSAGTVVKE